MTASPAGAADRPWPRLRAALLRRPHRAQVAVAALCGLLAFALVTQVHATASTGGLAGARVSDLLGILTSLDDRGDRLRDQVSDLQRSEAQLSSGSDLGAAALQQAQQRLVTLGILAGTRAARGPGIVLTVEDPQGKVRSDVLVDALEELRDAGAEAMQLSGVRVVASTAIVDDPTGGVDVDGSHVLAPYRLVVIGDPRTLAGALAIPGGVVDTVSAQRGAHAIVVQSPAVTVSALRALQTPRYARPASQP